MSATNYPGIAVHQLRHQWILEQNKALATQRGRKALERNSELLRYLADINDEHIRNDDLHYGLWLGTKAPRCAPAARNAMR
jgi:hemerythrin